MRYFLYVNIKVNFTENCIFDFDISTQRKISRWGFNCFPFLKRFEVYSCRARKRHRSRKRREVSHGAAEWVKIARCSGFGLFPGWFCVWLVRAWPGATACSGWRGMGRVAPCGERGRQAPVSVASRAPPAARRTASRRGTRYRYRLQTLSLVTGAVDNHIITYHATCGEQHHTNTSHSLFSH